MENHGNNRHKKLIHKLKAKRENYRETFNQIKDSYNCNRHIFQRLSF